MLDFLEKNKDITSLSGFKTPAKAKYYFEINDVEDVDKLVDIVNFANKNNLSYKILWGGTNILFAFSEYNWIIIKNNLDWYSYNEDTKILDAFSNASISDLAEIIEKYYDNKVWHRFIGLPGSVWWAVFWNAWCFGLETENNFVEAVLLDLETWEKVILDREKMAFEYRNSVAKQTGKYFIIVVKFDLSKVEEKYSSDVDNIEFRENKQPKGNCCWSFFKNPQWDSAWRLVDTVWLKWYKLWGAFFSEKHANFLMNDWNATYKDLLDLMKLAQKKVKKEYNIDLINEVQILKNN